MGGEAGIAARLTAFCEELRSEGVAVGTAELLDAFEALDVVSWREAATFREALAATIAKSREDRLVFDRLFDRHFFRVAEAEALRQGIEESESLGEGAEGVELSSLRDAVREAIETGDEDLLRDLARMSLAAFGRAGEGSGVVGVDVQRIRRGLGLQIGTQRPEAEGGRALSREEVARFEAHLRRELERVAIERAGKLPPSRPLSDLDRALPTSPTQDLAAVHRAVAQLKRRLATVGSESRGRRRDGVVDVRRTIRSSLETGGVPMRLRYRAKRPRRPEIYVLCDVSTSVTSASVFFLSVLHALHDSFRKLRSFVFIERIAEVSDVFETERDFRAVSERISRESGVADQTGYTDYGRVWLDFAEQVSGELGPRSTLIVLGDARTNGRDPCAEVFGGIASQSARTFWLNPEPRLYWNYGDSRMSAYEPYLDASLECWTTKHLEQFVDLLAKPGAVSR